LLNSSHARRPGSGIIQTHPSAEHAHASLSPLVLAIRVYPEPKTSEQNFDKPKKRKTQWSLPDSMFVFDTETSADHTQRLKFGSYRFLVSGRCLEEGLFYGDDLSPEERCILERYVSEHTPEVVEEGCQQLHLLTRRQFLDKLFKATYKARCLLVGFNLPFDISRIAHDFANARKRFAAGFSFGMWTYIDKRGLERRNPHRPRIAIKYIDNKRALNGFTSRSVADEEDLIPEGSTSGKPEKGHIFRGHFLDLRTLTFALTDRGYTLEAACEAFGVEHGKQRAERHGFVTEEYIAYNRRDVLATSELAIKVLDEYKKHPIDLQATKAYSPASIGKAYLRAMGIKPILERQKSFPRKYLGYSVSRVRKTVGET